MVREITALAHLKDLAITGPYEATGFQRLRVGAEYSVVGRLLWGKAPACAEEIISRLGPQAFRRSLTQDDLEG
ncbi:MAG: hypothetical protein CM1200mP14_11160 [Gammaproteobacteria bacterium]|nr:MAG: hypothetical protein CM1200mP14_11160 [Gammaproteobacteria bacterium]